MSRDTVVFALTHRHTWATWRLFWNTCMQFHAAQDHSACLNNACDCQCVNVHVERTSSSSCHWRQLLPNRPCTTAQSWTLPNRATVHTSYVSCRSSNRMAHLKQLSRTQQHNLCTRNRLQPLHRPSTLTISLIDRLNSKHGCGCRMACTSSTQPIAFGPNSNSTA